MKFKKHISLFLAILLLVSNVGFAFNVHYCGGTIASVSLRTSLPIQDLEKGCCEKITEKKDTCCKDKVVNFQKKSDDTTIKSFSFQFVSYFLVQEYQPIVYSPTPNFKNTQTTSYYCDANAPPLFKLYSQYIFYA